MPNPVRKRNFTHKKKGQYSRAKAFAQNSLNFNQVETKAAELGYTKVLGSNEFLLLAGKFQSLIFFKNTPNVFCGPATTKYVLLYKLAHH